MTPIFPHILPVPSLHPARIYRNTTHLCVNSSKLSSPCGSLILTPVVANPFRNAPALCTRREGDEKTLARATRAKAAEDIVEVVSGESD